MEGLDDLYMVASNYVPTSIYDNMSKGWRKGGKSSTRSSTRKLGRTTYQSSGQPKESSLYSVSRKNAYVYDYDDDYVDRSGVARVVDDDEVLYHASEDHGSGGKHCCELVVDPLSVVALFAAILVGTAFLNTVITMVLGRRKRRRRRGADTYQIFDAINLGKRLLPSFTLIPRGMMLVQRTILFVCGLSQDRSSWKK